MPVIQYICTKSKHLHLLQQCVRLGVYAKNQIIFGTVFSLPPPLFWNSKWPPNKWDLLMGKTVGSKQSKSREKLSLLLKFNKFSFFASLFSVLEERYTESTQFPCSNWTSHINFKHKITTLANYTDGIGTQYTYHDKEMFQHSKRLKNYF